MRFRVFLTSVLIAGSMGSIYASGLKFKGSMLNVLEETPEKNTGLDKIYIVYDTANVDLIYTSSDPDKVKMYKYSNLGGGYAEEIAFVNEGKDAVIKNCEGNLGYIIEDSGKRYYYWVVDYLPYKFEINSVSESEEVDCDATLLSVEGKGDPIHYFTINGQQRTLDRQISVEYTTQEWDSNEEDFTTIEAVKYFESLSNILRISPPAYSNTSFKISGDKFLQQWNWISEVESRVISPSGIMIMSEAIQEGNEEAKAEKEGNRNNDESENGESENEDNNDADEDASNVISSGDSGLGGSAPANISFKGYGTEGVLHYEWQLTKDVNFDDIDYRFNQKDIDYTFTEEGTYYMRLVGSNFDGSCDAVGDTYTINIGSSELKCPNAFTPDGDGVNDEWKVSYRSLLEFKCWIFDRFGNQIFYFNDPSMGWDGKRNGKLVKPGVYFYVIQAVGADNKQYKKSGDINILRHKNLETGSSETE